MRWKTHSDAPTGIPGPLVSPREFVERMADNIAKTTITMGGSVSTAYKAAAIFAEACESLWEKAMTSKQKAREFISAHSLANEPRKTPRLKVPQWVTSWPEWFDIPFPNSVTVVPLSDYEAIERESAELRERIVELERGVAEANQRADLEAAARDENVTGWMAKEREQRQRAERAEAALAKANKWYAEEYPFEEGVDRVYPWDYTR